MFMLYFKIKSEYFLYKKDTIYISLHLYFTYKTSQTDFKILLQKRRVSTTAH